MKLNGDQQACLEATEPALLCVATPGSGKTATLVERIVHDITVRGVHHSTMVVFAYTRLASREIRARLKARLAGRMPRVGTFHAIAYEHILKFWRTLGFASEAIAIFDSAEQKGLIKETIANSRYRVPISDVVDAIGHMSRFGELPADLPRDVAAVIEMYHRALREHGAVDYPSIPYLFCVLLENIESPARAIYVDEVQDLDASQFRAIRLMRPDVLFMVGDPDQSIYGFRGADPGLMFTDAARGTPVASRTLVVNYRCARTITLAALQLINNNPGAERIMTAAREIDGVLRIVHDDKAIDEVRSSVSREGTTAVLARTHDTLWSIAADLEHHQIPCTIVGRRERLLEREEIKLALAYLVWPEWASSAPVMHRVLRAEGCNDYRIEQIRAAAKREGDTFFQTAMAEIPGLAFWYGENAGDSILERLVYVFNRLRSTRGALLKSDEAALTALLTDYVRHEAFADRSAAGFLAWIHLRDGQDEVKPESTGAQLLTIHAAKGLEWDRVLIAGLDDRTLPHKRSHDEAGLQEERRLMYVAMTRARSELTLIIPDGIGERQVSRFVKEIAWVSTRPAESASGY